MYYGIILRINSTHTHTYMSPTMEELEAGPEGGKKPKSEASTNKRVLSLTASIHTVLSYYAYNVRMTPPPASGVVYDCTWLQLVHTISS